MLMFNLILIVYLRFPANIKIFFKNENKTRFFVRKVKNNTTNSDFDVQFRYVHAYCPNPVLRYYTVSFCSSRKLFLSWL